MKTCHPQSCVFYVAAVIIVTFVFVMVALTVRAANMDCPPGKVCIDPVNTSCFAVELKHGKWLPSSVEQRPYISALVYQGKAEYKFQKDGIDCYARDKHFVLGERVTQLPAEWWRPTK